MQCKMPEAGDIMDSESAESEGILLQPFMHQVSGHTIMLRFNNDTLCKPLITREQVFYENLPEDLKEFVPEYKGMIQVKLQEDSDGFVTFVAYSGGKSSKTPNNQSASSSASSSSETEVARSDTEEFKPQRIRLLRSGSIEVSAHTDTVFKYADPKSGKHEKTKGMNPWSIKCHKRLLSKLRKASNGTDSNISEFILLENVAAQFNNPCILDLKMGTRQHGDDVSEAKKQRHMKKCETTTSSQIGVRVCGMQVYQVLTDNYVCHNKYYGRSLTVDGFKDSLRAFLNNGCELRTDLLASIVRRLEELRVAISKQDTFRFYSSSLLIMYDGGSKSGLSTVLPKSEHHSVLHSDESNESNASTTSSDNDSKNINSASAPRNRHWKGSNIVDVRMIDFAHSTHDGFEGDLTTHSGPDHGYIFGLENLIKLFQGIR
ncbi:hypothetical protein KUTeg_006555 [Tegillarca granosa]|uniref:Kinase n=1 Tax=Tegillarca granosa TaxID=220873 RepID=A0ABQ9FIZ0_TEGGR|nr:hypothetical protein KUTeg_006555 [Tegillarca granosa]